MILCSDKFLDTMPKAEYMKEKKKALLNLKFSVLWKTNVNKMGKQAID